MVRVGGGWQEIDEFLEYQFELEVFRKNRQDSKFNDDSTNQQ